MSKDGGGEGQAVHIYLRGCCSKQRVQLKPKARDLPRVHEELQGALVAGASRTNGRAGADEMGESTADWRP